MVPGDVGVGHLITAALAVCPCCVSWCVVVWVDTMRRSKQQALKRRRLHNPNLYRVPTAELPPDAEQYRIVCFFRHMEDLPNPARVPPELRRCELKYTLFEEQYSVPVHLNVRACHARLVPKSVR